MQHNGGVAYGAVSILTRADSLQRIIDSWARVKTMRFRLLHVIAEDDLVTIVYQCDFVTTEDDEGQLSSIEVLRVRDGMICEIWNAAYSRGAWH